MAKKLCFALAVIGAALPSLLVAGTPDAKVPPVSVTVSVFNDARVPSFVLEAARQRAQAVFQKAGISLTWLDCGEPGNWHSDRGCLGVAFPEHLSVRLVEGRKAVSADIYGQSYLNEKGEGNYASVFAVALASSKALCLVKEGDLLGYVVVHELGHLLLGQDSHSTQGLMRARWEVSELHEARLGTLRFTAGEAQLMRSRYRSAKNAHIEAASLAAM